MTIHHASLIAAAFLCSLVAGFLFAFAVVVMPGIGRLPDREFMRAFQVMDRIIQNNQPLFLTVWVGSVVALVAAIVLTYGNAHVLARWLLLGAGLAWLLGVQLPTIAVNIPLNNRLQSVNVDALDEASQASARRDFEPRWNTSNVCRTAVACLVTLTLIFVLTTV
jgi:uncharacterized membrane protein